ncbi:hypothetical protein VE00_08652 [Pseudogymnoascus sp. WSF 3629]|nr:hypothetical protein VE00_08652 [Pseudogymnoascus sp. WSF 3629]
MYIRLELASSLLSMAALSFATVQTTTSSPFVPFIPDYFYGTTTSSSTSTPSDCPAPTSFPDVKGWADDSQVCATVLYEDNSYSTCCPYPPPTDGTTPVAYTVNNCFLPICVTTITLDQITSTAVISKQTSSTTLAMPSSTTTTSSGAAGGLDLTKGTLEVIFIAVVSFQTLFGL